MEILLSSEGLIRSSSAQLTPLTGGVSSEIYLVRDDAREFVVKRALAQLKVAGQWFADTDRNRNETAYIGYVRTFCPRNVPRLQFVSEKHKFFCMDYMGTGWQTWKQRMIAGDRSCETSSAAGALLGKIHAHSARNTQVASRFRTLRNFEQLRIEPYLLSTAQHHPTLRAIFHAEAARLRSRQEVLTHGDYSPKNILVNNERLVVVDSEAAWYGDAAFDPAFLLSHLFLKSLALNRSEENWRKMIRAAWSGYCLERFPSTESKKQSELEANFVRLLVMLMLARVDGKSPVEYLSEDQRTHVRTFSTRTLSRPPVSFAMLTDEWFAGLPMQFKGVEQGHAQ
jgi:5-methylthioribose kinase